MFAQSLLFWLGSFLDVIGLSPQEPFRNGATALQPMSKNQLKAFIRGWIASLKHMKTLV